MCSFLTNLVNGGMHLTRSYILERHEHFSAVDALNYIAGAIM